MPKLSEAAKTSSSDAAKRVQSEMDTVADVKGPPPPKGGKKKLGKLGG
jgi:hypothetical protein